MNLAAIKAKPEFRDCGGERLLCFPQLDGRWIPAAECKCKDNYDGAGMQWRVDCPIDRHAQLARNREMDLEDKEKQCKSA